MLFCDRRFSILAILLLVLSLLAFASGDKETQKAEKRLSVWMQATFVDAQNNWTKQKIEAWATENNVDVDLSIMSIDIYNEKFTAAVKAGTTPDAVLNAGGHVVAAESGLLVPIDDVINRIGEDDIYQAILDLNTVTDQKTGESHYYGLVVGFEVKPFEVRTDLLEQTGMTIPDEPDYDWVYQFARKVNDPPNLHGLGLTLGRCSDGYTNMIGVVYGYGGGLMKDLSPDGGDIFNSEPTWRAFRDLKQLYDEGVIPQDSISWPGFGNNAAYMEGRVATTNNGLSIYYKMRTDGNPLVDVTAEVPLSGSVVMDSGGKACFVFKTTPGKQELAKDLIHYVMSDKEGYRENLVEKADLFWLPIYKTQGEIITDQWRSGKWDMYGIDPMQATRVSRPFLVTYPYGEANSVAEMINRTMLLPEEAIPVFAENMDVKVMAKNVADRVNQLIVETYGK